MDDFDKMFRQIVLGDSYNKSAWDKMDDEEKNRVYQDVREYSDRYLWWEVLLVWGVLLFIGLTIIGGTIWG